jgi:nucleotide-binding universal stress UspA family protein
VPGVDRLIVGTSGSPGSLAALRYAEGLACAHHAVLIPVIAWEPPGGEQDERLVLSAPLRQACQGLACRQLRDALIAVWGEVPDDPLVGPQIQRGPAGRVLVTLACRPDDVLVVGAGRRRALARVALFRVSRYCLAHAQCPVLAIPLPELAREPARGWPGLGVLAPATNARAGPSRPAQTSRLRNGSATHLSRPSTCPAFRAVGDPRCLPPALTRDRLRAGCVACLRQLLSMTSLVGRPM